ncbi:Crp/Fnr family transcriptional regulator [Pedobacter helvus]|uniref:Crp/Fnr family transcriptional regulator n=1 Tax=Pedobacter helvus TaxID=2563444 RepID=A0ABW9JFV1_9SPHI|nr:Crp/Fnr family transcriptional regulator [Pedobacter ureilyticus]
MNTKIILQNISKHIALTKEEEVYFVSLLKEKIIKNKQYIAREGDVCKHISFINEGCCKTFNIDKNGFEHILHFSSQDYWVGDLYSIITQKPGVLFVQAMEETEVLQIAKTDMDSLYLKIPKFERVFRILAENAYVETQNRVMEGLGLSAKERYDIFNKKYAALKHLLPQKQIALYLGVTPEFFSRMKKKYQLLT